LLSEVNMTIATMNSRTFARDAAAVKRAAQQGPVIITERGTPALAVLCIEDYYRLTGQTGGPSLLQAMQALQAPEGVDLALPARDDAAAVACRLDAAQSALDDALPPAQEH
jgi:prevent-host-death family protein